MKKREEIEEMEEDELEEEKMDNWMREKQGRRCNVIYFEDP